MTDEEIKKREIESALAAIPAGDFLETSKGLLAVLGYRSERTVKLSGNTDDFIQAFPAENRNTKTEQEFRNHAASVNLLFQVTSGEIADSHPDLFVSQPFDEGPHKEFCFLHGRAERHRLFPRQIRPVYERGQQAAGLGNGGALPP